MTVNETLAFYRKLRKLSQRQLGEMIGYEGKVAKRMIQSYEYKQRPIPAKNIRKLANALDIPVDKLVP